MQVFQGDEMIFENDDWMNGERADEIATSDLAPADPKEAAVLVTLAPEVYTTVITGSDGAKVFRWLKPLSSRNRVDWITHTQEGCLTRKRQPSFIFFIVGENFRNTTIL